MDRHVPRFHRGPLGVLALAAAVLLVDPLLASAQDSWCSRHQCTGAICYIGQNGTPVCISVRAGCYGTYPTAGACNCPLGGGSSCVLTTDALTGDDGSPTEQQLMDRGFDVCYELVRERMKADRNVVLFDKETAQVVLTGADSVGVSGFAHPRPAVIPKDPRGPLDRGTVRNPEDEPVGRRFDCEVRRDANGSWTPLALTLAEDPQ